MGVAVIVGTFGAPQWRERAGAAVASARAADADEIVHVHGATLAEARNHGAERVSQEWLCFVDADDQLDPGYVSAMTGAAAELDEARPGTDWLLQPATIGMNPDGGLVGEPELIPRRPLLAANFMVIGTLIRRDQFRRVGGFRDLDCLEDWDLWLRAWIDGAQFCAVPDAVYRVGLGGSRNHPSRHGDVYRDIRATHTPLARLKGLA